MFFTRLGSGIVLLIIAFISMFVGGLPLLLILGGISLIAYKEVLKALGCGKNTEKINIIELLGYLSIIAYYVATYFVSISSNYLWLVMAICVAFLAQMFAYVFLFPKYEARDIVNSIFSFMYAPVMLSFIFLTRQSTQGLYIVWLILISSWGCDTCAYAVGILIGKKKIFPVLSPKKSLEGCIGGVLGAALIGGIYANFLLVDKFPDKPVVALVAIISAIGAIMSMVGDLAASAIKRNVNIKDYGKLIPGHGGIMDRFDSTIVTAPMVFFLMAMLLN